ncbi:MAG: GIY-YIG nuclease family protein [Candidatus Levybacteria bacterium]|nr:GIY-YIG nuclease family protein [Candidatus Levybacteria bacterium]
MYVGKAKNLKKRVNSYFAKYANLGHKTSVLVSKISKIKTIIVDSEIQAFLLEANFIKKYKPKYNIKLTDDKAYPLIRVTIKDSYPKILIARRTSDKNSLYFGPFPNSTKELRITLKIIRKIFPFQSVPNHPKKICLYNHLGLCPCPPVFDSPEFKKEYRKSIKHIIDFLNGKSKKIIKDLIKERDLLSSQEQFEKANVLQSKISAIELITGPYYARFDSDLSPNLLEDLRAKETEDLMRILNENKVAVKILRRIECFDISNVSGKNATGSMVVFTNGEKNSSQYRKFKIKTLNSPNDFAMMEEVLQRRIQHKEWPYPDLLIVDGGKGQVSSALKVLREIKTHIPIIGLAKKEETIISSDFKEIILSKNSDALKLVMRIRDEAHRFAITYHRKLRGKSFLL